MRTIIGKIYTAKVSAERVQEDGLAKAVKEEYAVKADSFSDCEKKLMDNVGGYDNQTNFEVLSEVKSKYKEVYIFDEGELFYKVKITETTYDEVNDKEKKTNFLYLLNADSLEAARKNIEEALGGTLSDYTIAAINELKVLEVIE